jgi:Peptidase_C39 like family
VDVPFISQLIGGQGGNNCGPAGIAMCLAYRGVIAPTQEAMLECADIARDGVSDDVGQTGGYTTLAQLERTANHYGQECRWVADWDGVAELLGMGEPVILLCDNTQLTPRMYPLSPSFNAHHFITLTAPPMGTGMLAVNDPLRTYEPVGPGEYATWSVQAGATNVGGVQGLGLEPIEAPDWIAMDTTWDEREDMRPYFEQLGVACNMHTAIMQRACLAFKRGESRGPAVSGEYLSTHADGRGSARQNFTAAIAEAVQAGDGTWQVNWMELVTNPGAIP